MNSHNKNLLYLFFAIGLGACAALSLAYRTEIAQGLSAFNRGLFLLYAFIPLALLAYFLVTLVSFNQKWIYVVIALVLGLALFGLAYSPIEILQTHRFSLTVPAGNSSGTVTIQKIEVGALRKQSLSLTQLNYEGSFQIVKGLPVLQNGASLSDSEDFLGDMTFTLQSSLCPQQVTATLDDVSTQVQVCQTGAAGTISLIGDTYAHLSNRSKLFIQFFRLIEFLLFSFLVYALIVLLYDHVFLQKKKFCELFTEIPYRREVAALLRDSVILLALIVIFTLLFNIKTMLYFSPALVLLSLDLFYQVKGGRFSQPIRMLGIVIFVLTGSILGNLILAKQNNPFMAFPVTINHPMDNTFNSLLNTVSNPRTNVFIFGAADVLYQREMVLSQADADELALLWDNLVRQSQMAKLDIEPNAFAELTGEDVSCLSALGHTTWTFEKDRYLFLNLKYYQGGEPAVLRRQGHTYFLIPAAMNDAQSWCQ